MPYRQTAATIQVHFSPKSICWGKVMQIVVESYKGLSLIVGLNLDRLFFLGTITVGLLAGAFLGSAIIHP